MTAVFILIDMAILAALGYAAYCTYRKIEANKKKRRPRVVEHDMEVFHNTNIYKESEEKMKQRIPVTAFKFDDRNTIHIKDYDGNSLIKERIRVNSDDYAIRGANAYSDGRGSDVNYLNF